MERPPPTMVSFSDKARHSGTQLRGYAGMNAESPRQPRAVVYVLAGALTGAVASVLGAYVATEKQSDLDALATKREAYAAFIVEADQYARQLLTVTNALSQVLATLTEESRLLDEASGELYAAESVVWLVGDRHAAAVAADTFEWLSGTRRGPSQSIEPVGLDAKVDALAKRVSAGRASLGDFIEVARDDLANE